MYSFKNTSIVNCVEEIFLKTQDRHLVAIGDQQGRILVFDVKQLNMGPIEIIRAFDRDTGVRSLSVSQGRLACCDSRGIVQIYDIAADEFSGGVRGQEPAASPDASGALGESHPRPQRASRPRILRLRLSVQAHPEQIHKVRLSPDGVRVATAGMDHVVKLWALQGDCLVKLSQVVVESCCMDLAFNSTGQLLLVGCDKFPRLFNVQNGRLEQVKQYGGHAKSVTAVGFGD